MWYRSLCLTLLFPALIGAGEDADVKAPPWHLVDIWWDIGQDTAFESYNIDAAIATKSRTARHVQGFALGEDAD